MRWPWTSVARLDDAKEEVERLRGQVERLQEQLVRVARRQAGLAEEVRQPPAAPDPMPQELIEYCSGWANPTRRMIRNELFRRRKSGTPWKEMVAELHRDGEPGHGTNGDGVAVEPSETLEDA